jgi:hypothetical protein
VGNSEAIDAKKSCDIYALGLENLIGREAAGSDVLDPEVKPWT